MEQRDEIIVAGAADWIGGRACGHQENGSKYEEARRGTTLVESHRMFSSIRAQLGSMGARVANGRRGRYDGPALVIGVRYRSYMPDIGIHPLVPARQILDVRISHPECGAHRVQLHAWRPDGDAYDGLPASIEEARLRRQERVSLNATDPVPHDEYATPPAPSLTPYCFDTR